MPLSYHVSVRVRQYSQRSTRGKHSTVQITLQEIFELLSLQEGEPSLIAELGPPSVGAGPFCARFKTDLSLHVGFV